MIEVRPTDSRKEATLQMLDVAKVWENSKVPLEKLESTDAPQECVVPYSLRLVFENALKAKDIPYETFDDLDMYNGKTNISQVQGEDFLYAHLGYTIDGYRIAPSVIRMPFTQESVIEFCKGYSEKDPSDEFWSNYYAYVEAERILRELDPDPYGI